MESKDLIKVIEADSIEFKALTDKWVAANDVAAAAKSRSYAKRLMKSLKKYVSASIADAEKVPAIPEPIVKEVVEPETVFEEVTEVKEGSW